MLLPKTAKIVVERDHYRCFLCGEENWLAVHHIVPRSRTSKKHPGAFLWDLKNLVLLCQRCHEKAHTRAARISLLNRLKEMFQYDYSEYPFLEYMK